MPDRRARVALWHPQYLERLARTYWKYLSRVTLGLIRVVLHRARARRRPDSAARSCCCASARRNTTSRAIAESCSWRIQDGLLVSRRNEGCLEIDVRRMESDRQGYGRVHVEVEVSNFYPAIAHLGRALGLRPDAVAHPRARHARLPALARPARARGVRRRPLRARAVASRSTSATRRGRASRCSSPRSPPPCSSGARATSGYPRSGRRSRARSIPATSISASREDGLAPIELMKPWKRPGKRRASTGDTGRAQRLGVGLALVAQRVEARRDHERRRGARQVLRQDRRAQRSRRHPSPPA